jgi:hypothetical protein
MTFLLDSGVPAAQLEPSKSDAIKVVAVFHAPVERQSAKPELHFAAERLREL